MENIIENNKLIAEFMGFEIIDEYCDTQPNQEFTDSLPMLEYMFSSWEEIIHVVEKIENLEHDFAWSSKPFSVKIEGLTAEVCIDSGISESISTDGENFYSFKLHATKSKLESTYQAVVEFIKWYNENK